MHTIWQFFIRNNRFSYLLMFSLLLFGVLSLVLIPKESAPEVQVPVGVVTTILPGAPASDVETLITNEIERGLNGVLNNVEKITSSSREGVSSVTVEFEASADIDVSIDELKDEIDLIKTDLPDDAEDPTVTEVDFVDQPIMTVALSGSYSDLEFSDLADALEADIESLPGISRVVFSGVREREVTVIVDQASLTRFELSLNDVIRGLQSANQTLPVGQIENNGVIYNIAFEGDIVDTTEIGNIALTTRGNQPVYVRDIAKVEDGLGPVTSISRLSVDGEPSLTSVSFDVFKQRGGDITAIARLVNERLENLQSPDELLSEATVKVLLDSGADIEEDLIRLSSSGVQTVILVVLVLIAAIGWREGLVAGTAIPLSFVIGFIGLYLSGNTINFVSLFALILAIGILVDSAIVMVEGINKRMKADPDIDKRAAALDTVKEYSTPLMAGTLTTVSMFSGLFIVSGVTGQFIEAIPFTINFILFASLLVALGFVPLIASTFLRRRSATNFEQQQIKKSQQLEAWYQKVLLSYLDNEDRQFKFLALINALFFFAFFMVINVFIGVIAAPLIYFFTYRIYTWQQRKGFGGARRFGLWAVSVVGSIVVAVLIASSVLPSMNLVRVVFFEQSDIDFIFAEVELPQGSVKENTDIAVRRVEEILYQNTAIDSFSVTIGSGSAFGGGGNDEKLGNIFINLKEVRDQTSTEVVETLRADLAFIRDIKITIDQPSDGPPTGDPLGYRFLGPDLVELTQLAEQSAEILKGIPETTNVTTSATNNSTEFVFTLDKAKTASLGLDPFTVSQTLRSAVFGTDATTLTTLEDEIDITVKLNLSTNDRVAASDTNITSIETLENLELQTPTGETVLLSTLVTTSLRESSSVIRHEGGDRVISLAGGITSNGNIQEINAEFEKRINEAGLLPETVRLEVGGETEESNQSFIELGLAVIVGVILMIGVLVLQFNSFLHTRYVISILPYSLIGIFAGLAITQLPLSFPSVMGFIALSGIVVNNSILLIDVMNENRRKYRDRSVKENVVAAATSRLRPILLTTITTVVGMIPLTYASDLWSPLAYAIMFGLTFSVVITLLLIPIVYLRKPGSIEN